MVAAPDNSKKGTTIVQITDSHLFHEDDGCLLGVPTLHSLTAVVDRLLEEQGDVQLVLGTGDISQDGSLRSYQHFARQAGRIGAPMRWIAGNHDVNMVQLQASKAAQWLEPVYDFPQWRIILLNSSVDGAVFGHLGEEQLQLLERSLESAGERHVMVCLHHHPVDIGCGWLKSLGLRNAADFFAILDRYSCVKLVLWGHIHQDFSQERKGVQLLASPSTSVQFKPGTAEFSVHAVAPGYRWLRLFEDGSFATGVSRIAENVFVPDQGVTGY